MNEAIGELLVLLSQKAAHQVLTEKVEALHRHIQALRTDSIDTRAYHGHPGDVIRPLARTSAPPPGKSHFGFSTW